MKSVFLIRHAESLYNTGDTEDLDSGLSRRGLEQVGKIGDFLKDTGPGFTSPYLRCLMTSRAVWEKTGIPFAVDADLAELTDHYNASVRVSCRRGIYPEMGWDGYCPTTFGGESQAEFLSRLRSFWAKVPDRSVVVTHGSVVQTLVLLAAGAAVDRVPVWDNSVENGSVTWVTRGEIVWLSKK